jgi:hypothetical protein
MKLLITAVLIIIFHASYSQKDSVGQTTFTKLRCGLYKNDIGDIGFKTSFRLDDLSGIDGIGFQTYGYLMDDTTTNGPHELKNIVDTNSFEILNDYYCKDKNYVYAIFYRMDGAVFNITNKIDSKSFFAFSNSSYGIDKMNIYFRADIVKEADCATFKIIDEDPNGGYDKNNYFNYGEIISIAEAKQRGYNKKRK